MIDIQKFGAATIRVAHTRKLNLGLVSEARKFESEDITVDVTLEGVPPSEVLGIVPILRADVTEMLDLEVLRRIKYLRTLCQPREQNSTTRT